MIPAYIAKWSLDRDDESREAVYADGSVDVIDDTTFDEEEVVLETKGGAPPPPPAPNPMAEARAQMALEEARARRESEAEARRLAREAAEREVQRGATSQQANNVYNTMLDYGRQQLQARGLVPGEHGVMSLFTSNLDRARQGVPEVATDVGSYFSPNLFDDAFSAVEGGQRGQMQREFRNTFGPDYSYGVFGDEADDPILDAILGEQHGFALEQLDAAKSRGQLQDTAYNFALEDINKAKTVGRNQLEDMGLSVLDTYRQQIEDRLGRESGRIDAFTLGDTYDLGQVQSGVSSLADRLRGRMEGDIYSRVGDTQFFDVPGMIVKGKNKSGLVNPGALGTPMGSTTATTGTDPNKDKNLGTQGVF